MTALLERAVAKARALPEDQQDALATMLLGEIEDEALWDEAFARPASHDLLARMATDAMAEHRAGQTRDLDPDALGREG